ncbi:MAG: hypothetical protein ACI9VS_000156 [Candidatus Binatia bacterium]
MRNPTDIALQRKPRLPENALRTCNRRLVRPTEHILTVSVERQRLSHFRLSSKSLNGFQTRDYWHQREYVISTSRFGTGQKVDSQETPLGLHRIAEKIGAFAPVGTFFRERKPVGMLSEEEPDAPIAHRILWLAGVERGFNLGGDVDSHSRYIYIHGVGDESTLGRPASIGCVHMAADDLIPLFDLVPVETLVWISRS